MKKLRQNFFVHNYTVCVFFSREQKVNNSGEFSLKYRQFSRSLDTLFPLKKHTVMFLKFPKLSAQSKI